MSSRACLSVHVRVGRGEQLRSVSVVGYATSAADVQEVDRIGAFLDGRLDGAVGQPDGQGRRRVWVRDEA